MLTTAAGLEPARRNASRFQVYLLNHSDMLSSYLLMKKNIFYKANTPRYSDSPRLEGLFEKEFILFLWYVLLLNITKILGSSPVIKADI